MTPQEKLKFFWSSGILPGTIADDLNDRNDRKRQQFVEEPRRRRVNLLRLISLGLLG